MEKLQAIVQKAGLARRKAISLIQSGGVKVNGKVIIEPWHEVSAEDKVEFGGYIYKVSDIIKADRKVYYLYNKCHILFNWRCRFLSSCCRRRFLYNRNYILYISSV